jgi:PPOX class probable F420-dependent enzyme
VAITQEKSWKVKRIRNTSRVTIAECDRGGKPKGEAVEAVATILDKSANGATYDALGKRYGLLGKTFNIFSKLRGGMKNNVSIQLKAVN